MHKTECNISLQIMKMDVDEFGRVKLLPRVTFYAIWTRADLKPIQHVEIVKLRGTKLPCSIRVECCAGVLMDEGERCGDGRSLCLWCA